MRFSGTVVGFWHFMMLPGGVATWDQVKRSQTFEQQLRTVRVAQQHVGGATRTALESFTSRCSSVVKSWQKGLHRWTK